MLSIKLHQLPGNRKFVSYKDAVGHLSNNTVVQYRGGDLRPRGNGKPSFDASQVCCWLSEQPLTNGRYLCTRNDANGNIKLISEPRESGMNMEPIDQSLYTSIGQADSNDLLLISGDCYAGLKTSLEEFANERDSQEYIKNPFAPGENVPDPLNFAHYIWPNFSYNQEGIEMEQRVIPSFSNNESVRGTIDSSQCFIYQKRPAAIMKTIDFFDGGSAPTFERSEEFVFVEANPELPAPLFTMAKNTIRLFRLNSLNYEEAGTDYHVLNFSTYSEAQLGPNDEIFEEITKESYFDDLRLIGRMEAFKRSRKSLDQLRNLRNLLLDPETLDEFIRQYRVLMELSGYRSTWAAVFNDGGDPGGFNDILGPVPFPVAPIPAPVAGSVAGNRKRKKGILDIDDHHAVKRSFTGFFSQKLSRKKYTEVDWEKLLANVKVLKRTPEIWEDDPFLPSRKRLRFTEEEEFADQVMLGVLPDPGPLPSLFSFNFSPSAFAIQV